MARCYILYSLFYILTPMDQTSTNTSIINTLVELGLGQNEAIMYEILLKNPNASIPVLSKASQFSRTMLYYVLNNLIAMELANSSKTGKKTVYNSAPPEKLEEFVADQQKELDRQKNALKGIIPDLGSIYRLSHKKPGLRFFEGISGVREVWWDSLSSKTEIYTYGDLELLATKFSDLNSKFVKERVKRNIVKKAITNDSPFNRDFLNKYDRTFTFTRLISGYSVDFSSTIMNIYDGKVSYTTLVGDSTIGVIISDKQI